MTRQKTVFKHDEIYHVWAHQLAKHGKTRGKASFNGPTFTHYSTDIAKIIERKGKRVYLLNTTSYSNTTTRHQKSLACAIPCSAIVFKIGGLGRGVSLDDVTGSMLFDYSIKQAAECAAKAKHARSRKDIHIAKQAQWLEQAKQVCVFFGLCRKVDDKAIERIADRVAKERKRQAKEVIERQVIIEKEKAEIIEKWLKGENVQFPYNINRVYLRQRFISLEDILRGKDQSVMETSKGVRVLLEDARRAFQFVMEHKEKLWERNGEQFKIGDYHIDRVTKQGVIAGCHHVTWDEIERFATLQGWK
jgi:hypothetical protein